MPDQIEAREPVGTTSPEPEARLTVVTVSDYDWPTGGIEEALRQVLKGTADEFEHHVVSWTSGALASTGVSFLPIEHGDVNALLSSLNLADVIVLMTSFNVRALAWLVSDLLETLDVPVVTVVHTSSHSGGLQSLQQVQLARLRRLVGHSAAVVAVSEDVARAVTAVAGPETAVTLIENGARELPSLGTARRVRGRKRVAFIGRPHPQKGFGEFRRVARDLSGGGLTFAANTVSVAFADEDGIAYSSNLTDQALRRFFDAADVVVAPYLNADGMPLALLEAISCGVPIIGYDSPGVGDLLRRHHQAVIPATYEALLEAVRDWAEGRLAIPEPIPSRVTTWGESAAEYARVFRAAAASRADIRR